MPRGPQLQVADVQRIFNDGNHNAFTDLCRFRGRYYVTFRSCPDGHSVSATARIGSDAPKILAELGYSKEQVARLVSSGAVGQTEWAQVKRNR